MQSQATAARDEICVARGYGLKIRVGQRGHLVVEDGAAHDRQTRRYHLVTGKLRRLVVIGQTGYITLDALRWLHDTGAALVHLDPHGRLLTTSTPHSADLPALRRAQALAPSSTTGVEIARWLLGIKIAGQQAVLAQLPEDAGAGAALDGALAEIDEAPDLPQLLLAESQAAEAYWQAWSALPIPFPTRDAAGVPDHWRTFGHRRSLLTNGPRNATNPPGAILNYLYALIEAETTLALHAVGLDPGLGIFHLDQRDRDSLSLDLMEAIRPLADAYLLALLTQRTLPAHDFVETRRGGCRLHPRFAAELADTLPAWRQHVAPLAEQLAHAFADTAAGKAPKLTPLTRTNQRAAWDLRAPERQQRARRGNMLVLPTTCRSCGKALPDRRRRYCDQCRRAQVTVHATKAREQAAAVLAQLRAEQRDPAHGGRAAQVRGSKNAAHQRAVRDWTGGRPDPAAFSTEILPRLRTRAIGELVEATGLSEHYCSLIRLGKKVPHPRHWTSLRHLADRRS